jgi:hypothetical protein
LIEVQIHKFLKGTGSKGTGWSQGYCWVKEVNCWAIRLGFPLELFAGGSKVIHLGHKRSVCGQGIEQDDKGVINELGIEEDVRIGDQNSFFMEGVVDDSIGTGAGCAHHCTIQLQLEAVAKCEDIALHDGVEAFQDFFVGKAWWNVIRVEVKPVGNCLKSMVGIDITIHWDGIGSEDSSVGCWEGILSFEAVQEVPAAFKVGWAHI